MNFKKPIILLFAFAILSCSLVTQAQSLKQYIPSTTTFVMGVNWKRLEGKVSTNQFANVESENIDQIFMELFLKIMESPEQYGLDFDEQTYLINDINDSASNQVALIALKNRDAFITNVTNLLKSQYPNVEFNKAPGNRLQYAMGDLAVSCSNDMAIIIKAQLHHFRYYSYYSEELSTDPEYINFDYWRERTKVIHKIDSIRYSGNDPYAEQMKNNEDYAEPEVAEEEMISQVEEVYEESEEEAVEYVEEDYYDEDIAYAEEEPEAEYGYYNYDRHPLMIALNAKRDSINRINDIVRKKKQSAKTLTQLTYYLKLPADKTNANNTRFNNAINNEHDICMWLNPLMFYNMYSRSLYREMIDVRKLNQDTAQKIREPSSFDKLLTGNYSYAYGDFNKGSLSFKFIQERSDELKEFEYVKGQKINQQMLNYIGNETFGYIALNTNPQAYFESYRKFMSSMIESFPMKTYATAQFEMMDIFINKDIFYNTLKGDAVVAFTGVRTVINTHQEYVYDEETFKREYKEVSDTSLAPEVLFIGSIEKEENVDRLLLAFEHMHLLVKIGNNVYQALKEPDGAGLPLYFAKHNGLIIITNNEELVKNHLVSGLPKNEQISGEARNLLTQYGNCQYWNSQKSFDAILEVGKEMRRRDKSAVKSFQKHLSTGTMYSVSSSNGIETTATLNFNDGSVNSLAELLSMLNELRILR
ncbi:MAG: hypothetical protein GC181_01270 [Bacteroidetes bacterium]|nr:hypothetical protein [Bacteroidota bacterium]